MIIDGVSFLNTSEVSKNTAAKNNNVNFGDVLKNELDKVNDTQVSAEEATQSLITGETTDVHQVLLATEEARLSLELAVQIRNKLVDAYQEISRMQI